VLGRLGYIPDSRRRASIPGRPFWGDRAHIEIGSAMRIAVIGSGIGGMGAAWLLSKEHDVDVFEADDRCGGHACTYDATVGESTYPVDVGFMVFNDRTYPNLVGLFGELGIESRETEMSFSIHVDDTGMEWAGTDDVRSVFAQPANALNPKFLGMLKDIGRIGHDAQRLLADESLAGCTLGQLLEREGYGEGFREWYLVPMASAIWSAPPGSMLEFPAHTFLRFSHNHGLLYVTGRPKWRTVLGGSREYVRRIEAKVAAVFTGHVVRRVTREDGRVRVGLTGGWSDLYDAVVIAVHAPDALQLLTDPTPAERELLSAFRYEKNPAVLHTDMRFLPKTPKARAAWNYWSATGDLSEQRVSVTYDLSRLQGHDSPTPILITLNPTFEPDPATVIEHFEFEHPAFTRESVEAQARLSEIQGVRGTYFAGAWQRYGFHEDGMLSAVRVARMLGVEPGWDTGEGGE
jgi:predicted NAD/FAD-binding protein